MPNAHASAVSPPSGPTYPMGPRIPETEHVLPIAEAVARYNCMFPTRQIRVERVKAWASKGVLLPDKTRRIYLRCERMPGVCTSAEELRRFLEYQTKNYDQMRAQRGEQREAERRAEHARARSQQQRTRASLRALQEKGILGDTLPRSGK